MKRVTAAIILAVFTSPAWALTFMGAPTSTVKQGDVLLGFDYSDGKFDDISGFDGDIDSQLFLARVGLGVVDGFEVFGRLGFLELEDSDNEFAWGFGTKVTLGRQGKLSWGALFQFLTVDADGETPIADGVPVDVDWDLYEYQVALGARYDMGPLSIYGGPFFDFIDDDLDVLQDSEFGGYVGLLWNMARDTSLSVEYQATGDADMIGVGLVHRFGAPSKAPRPVVLERPSPAPPREPEAKAPDRVITGYTIKQDPSGRLVKDPEGNFIIIPIYEDEQQK